MPSNIDVEPCAHDFDLHAATPGACYASNFSVIAQEALERYTGIIDVFVDQSVRDSSGQFFNYFLAACVNGTASARATDVVEAERLAKSVSAGGPPS